MKRTIVTLVCAAVFGAAASVVLAPAISSAEVSVNITVPLPGLYIPAPPPLIVIPGTYVYYPPAVGVDIFFYRGHWYRPYQGGWYIAGGYNGPWRVLDARRVPPALYQVPRDFRRIPPVHERLPYATVRHNWRAWENERHWDHVAHDRGEHHDREHHGREHGEGHERRG